MRLDYYILHTTVVNLIEILRCMNSKQLTRGKETVRLEIRDG